jgi:hypothetical protein
MVLLLNTVYLFGTTPYFDTMDSVPDYLNVVALLLLSILQATYSAWVPNATLRYYNGMAFVCLLSLNFVINCGLIGGAAARPVILRVKRALYRRKNKAVMKKK